MAVRHLRTYSHQMARIGSTLMARVAGTQDATKPTSVTENMTTAKFNGSVALKPSARKKPRGRMTSTANTAPMALPTLTRTPVSRNTKRMIFKLGAPMAMRIPNSRVRAVTSDATTPNNPTIASTSARSPIDPINIAPILLGHRAISRWLLMVSVLTAIDESAFSNAVRKDAITASGDDLVRTTSFMVDLVPGSGRYST